MSEVSITLKERRLPAIYAIGAMVVVCLAVLLAQWPILRGDFCNWDDPTTIAGNPLFLPPTSTGFLQHWQRGFMSLYVPVTYSVWHGVALLAVRTAEEGNWRLDPMPFKVLNVCLHATCGLLVLLIGRRLFDCLGAGLVAALVFAVHPVQVETVGWTSGAKDLLFALMGLSCFAVYTSGRPIAAMPLLVLAGLCKPTAMVIPILIGLHEILIRRHAIGITCRRLIPLLLTGVVIALIAKLNQPNRATVEQVGILWRPLVALMSGGFYITQTLWPTRLGFDYGLTPRTMIDATGLWWWAALPIIWAAWLGVARSRRAWFCFGWAVASVAPVLGLVSFDFQFTSTVADHYMYLSMAGVGLGTGLIWMSIRSAWRQVIMVVLLLWAVMSTVQASTWRDAESMLRQVLRVNERSAIAWGNLGAWHLERGELELAESSLRRSVALRDDIEPAMHSLGVVFARRGKLVDAERMFDQAQQVRPNENSLIALANVKRRLGKFDQAARLAETLLRDVNANNDRAMMIRARALAGDSTE
jgi:protein O-mannosyl-transferase